MMGAKLEGESETSEPVFNKPEALEQLVRPFIRDTVRSES